MMTKERKPVFHYLMALVIQIIMLLICMFCHRTVVAMGDYIGRQETVGGSLTLPTLGRMIFMFAAAAMCVVFTMLASKYAKRGNIYIPFILGMFAGTGLWQAIGEDCWHFSVNGTHFLQLESVSVFPIFVLFVFLVIYVLRRGSFDWGVLCMILSFGTNWFGHYVLEGIYPFFASAVPMGIYMKIVGITLGSIMAIIGIVIGVKTGKTQKNCMLAAILTYAAMGVLAFSFIEG